jgi:hypothetical protein
MSLGGSKLGLAFAVGRGSKQISARELSVAAKAF